MSIRETQPTRRIFRVGFPLIFEPVGLIYEPEDLSVGPQAVSLLNAVDL